MDHRDPLTREVLAWIAEHAHVPIEDLRAETDLRTLVLDSLDYVELILAFEEQFGADIKHPGLMLNTVGDLVAHLRDAVKLSNLR